MTRGPLATLALACCVLGLLSGGSAAGGQSARLEGTVLWEPSIGFGGVYKQGAWTPVFVDISNEGDSQTGEIRLPVYQRSRAGRRGINYSIPVEVPRNSRKRYVLYVPPEDVEKIYLRLGRTQSEQELSAPRIADRDDTLAVVLGGDRGLLNFLTGTSAAPQALPAVVVDPETGGFSVAGEGAVIQVGHAAWDGLPDSWLGWDGVDAVILGDAGFSGASQQSLEALLLWVHLGGTLIVPGGALAPQMAASPMAELLPIEVRGTATLPDLGELEAWTQQPIEHRPALAAEGPLAPDASVLCGTTERPLIAVRRVGAGRVAMTSFDFGAAPVKYWDGQAAMWQRLLAQAPPSASLTMEAEETFPYEPLITLADAATYTPAAALPPFWLLLGFLGAYIIVLVPVNYSLLKRFDRRELAWVTTPAIVLVFTLGAYGVGYGMRGGKIILNRLGIIEAAPGAGLVRGRGYVGLFSPGRTTYDLLLQEGAAGARDLAEAEERTRGSATIRGGPNPAVADVAMNMWTSRAFAVEFLADLQEGIDGALEWDGSDLRATVENNTGLRLRQCRLIRGSTQGQKRDIKAGNTVTWSFGRGGSVGDRHAYRGGRQTQLDAREGMAELAVRSLFGERPRQGGRGPIWRRQPYLVALVDEPLVPVRLGRRGAEANDLNLLIAELPVRIESGAGVAVPHWLIRSRPIAADASIGRGSPWDPTLTISNGSAVFEFLIPFGEKGGEAVQLALSAPYTAQTGPGGSPGLGGRRGPGIALTPAGPGGGALPLSVSAYNVRLGRWEALPAPPTIPFPTPSAYMSREGRVLVKVDVPSDSVSFEDIALSAEVNAF